MGTGLQGIVDRLDTVDGTISIDSRPGAGTTVSGTIPIAAAQIAVPELSGASR